MLIYNKESAADNSYHEKHYHAQRFMIWQWHVLCPIVKKKTNPIMNSMGSEYWKSITFGLVSVLRMGAWKRSRGSVVVQSWYFAGKSTLDSQRKKENNYTSATLASIIKTILFQIS